MSSKKILIINGHPNLNSFNYAIHEAYLTGLKLNGNTIISEIKIAEMAFDINVQKARAAVQIEQDIKDAQLKIEAADHIVWIYPLWWGMMPALLKGFIDRVLTPGFAFNYTSKGKIEKLMTGKTTEIICTLDYPIFIFKTLFNGGGVKVMRKMILNFCGFKNSKTTYIGPIIKSTPAQREKWLSNIKNYALSMRC